MDPERLVLVVVGADLRAEACHRALAESLCRSIRRWGEDEASALDVEPLAPLTCTDLWHMNDALLRRRPAIALGGPDVNATTAWLGSRLPTAFVIEGRLRIHLDPEFVEEQVCLWGVDDAATAAAVQVFAERYLDRYLRSIHGVASCGP
jgi:hypothetical protein